MAIVFTRMFNWNSDSKGKIILLKFIKIDIYISCVTTICLIGIAVGSLGVGHLVNIYSNFIDIYGTKDINLFFQYFNNLWVKHLDDSEFKFYLHWKIHLWDRLWNFLSCSS